MCIFFPFWNAAPIPKKCWIKGGLCSFTSLLHLINAFCSVVSYCFSTASLSNRNSRFFSYSCFSFAFSFLGGESAAISSSVSDHAPCLPAHCQCLCCPCRFPAPFSLSDWAGFCVRAQMRCYLGGGDSGASSNFCSSLWLCWRIEVLHLHVFPLPAF